MSNKRRKGIAIVDSNKGILLVAGRSKKFMLPGGGTNKSESRRHAAVRELYEETGLKTKSIKYLFSYIGKKWHKHNGISVRNHTKVFIVKPIGKPNPRHEIKYISFWKLGSDISMTGGTKKIIKIYLEKFKK